ncbi:MAG: polysaccharide biosynthesis tyrosine autokinase [Anaerolineaceae bacterium]|jgi:non-specific protein-tyrosine kinase|nr:polysaccharide biosynthesis tyrosine autokinase [Anaerolineaceae bacterium]
MQDYINEPQEQDDSETIRDYLMLFWRWAWLIILAGVLAGTASFLLSMRMDPVYEAKSTVLISEASGTSGTDYSSLMASERLTRTYSEVMSSETVLVEVSQLLGITMPLTDMAGMITVTPVRDTQLIELAVRSSDPEQAARIANTLVGVFTNQIQNIQSSRYSQSKDSLQTQLADLERQIQDYSDRMNAATSEDEIERLDSKLSQYQQIYSNLLMSFEQVRLAEAQSSSNITQIEPASVPYAPVSPNVLRNTVLAVAVGMMLAAGGLVAREALDDTVKSPREVQRLFGLPVLGVIARNTIPEAYLITDYQPRSPVTEAYRMLRTNIQFANIDRPVKTLLVTSAEPQEGKTTIAANLAVVNAQNGSEVTLMDCDLRRPTVHKRFKLPNQKGFSTLFISTLDSLDQIRQVSKIPHLSVLTSGPLPPNPSELIGSRRMIEILKRVGAKGDLIIIDSPPTLAVTDSSILAPVVDGVLLVITPGETRRTAVRQMIEQLNRVGGTILGVVFNNFNEHRTYYSYRSNKYYARYGKYFSEDTQELSRRKA